MTIDSPSYEAGKLALNCFIYVIGIRKDDLIVRFGPVNYMNNDGLKYLAETVKGNIGNKIPLFLLRELH